MGTFPIPDPRDQGRSNTWRRPAMLGGARLFDEPM